MVLKGTFNIIQGDHKVSMHLMITLQKNEATV